MTINHPEIDSYRNFLDEVHEEVTICGYTYSASHAFEMVDPIAFNVGFNDYLSWLEDNNNEPSYKDLKAT